MTSWENASCGGERTPTEEQFAVVDRRNFLSGISKKEASVETNYVVIVIVQWLFFELGSCRKSRCIHVSSSARGNGFTYRHERLASPVIKNLGVEDEGFVVSGWRIKCGEKMMWPLSRRRSVRAAVLTLRRLWRMCWARCTCSVMQFPRLRRARFTMIWRWCWDRRMKDVLRMANDVRGIIVDEKNCWERREFGSAHRAKRIVFQNCQVTLQLPQSAFPRVFRIAHQWIIALGTVVTVGVAKRGPQHMQRFHKRRHPWGREVQTTLPTLVLEHHEVGLSLSGTKNSVRKAPQWCGKLILAGQYLASEQDLRFHQWFLRNVNHVHIVQCVCLKCRSRSEWLRVPPILWRSMLFHVFLSQMEFDYCGHGRRGKFMVAFLACVSQMKMTVRTWACELQAETLRFLRFDRVATWSWSTDFPPTQSRPEMNEKSSRWKIFSCILGDRRGRKPLYFHVAHSVGKTDDWKRHEIAVCLHGLRDSIKRWGLRTHAISSERIFLLFAASYDFRVEVLDLMYTFLQADSTSNMFDPPPNGQEREGWIWDGKAQRRVANFFFFFRFFRWCFPGRHGTVYQASWNEVFFLCLRRTKNEFFLISTTFFFLRNQQIETNQTVYFLHAVHFLSPLTL